MLSFLQQIRRVRGELIWVLIGHATAFIGGVAGIKALTSLLGPENYGRMALGLTIAGFLTTFLHNPLSNSAARFYSPFQHNGQGLVYFAVLRSLHLKLLLILLPFVLIVPLLVAYLFDKGWGLLVLAGLLFGLVNGIWVSCLAWQNAARERRRATLSQIADVWLRISIAILLAMLFASGEGALFGYVIGTSLVLFWQNRLAVSSEKILITKEAVPTRGQLDQARREFIRFSLPFAGYALFTSLTLYADRWIVQGIAGAESVGIYAAMFQLASSPVNILFAVINQLMVPIVYEKARGGMYGEIKTEIRILLHRIAGFGMLILIVMLVPLYFWCKPLARLFTTTTFAEQASLIPLLVLGMGLFHIGQIYTLEGNCCNRPGVYLWAKIAHAMLLCFSGVLLTYNLGVYGMALAVLIASSVYLVAVPLINFRWIK